MHVWCYFCKKKRLIDKAIIDDYTTQQFCQLGCKNFDAQYLRTTLNGDRTL